MLLDAAGLLVWPGAGLLAVADLHLEKGSAGARAGSLLPPWDSRITLERLAAACARYRPSVVVAVGDSFHDGFGAGRLSAADRARLFAIAEGRRVVWVAGNHDPHPMMGVPGEAAGEFRAGPLLLRHEARRRRRAAGTVEVCGHFHPKAVVATRGGGVSRPCFVVCASGERVMLPAFGAYAGGLDVSDPAIRGLFPAGGRVFLTGAERVFGFEMAEA
jgi:DNA ligase-associated metallophosphoesterase